MSLRNQQRAKVWRWLKRWFVVVLRESISPIFNRQEVFSVLSLPIFLFLLAMWVGSTEATQEIEIWWAGKVALVLTLPVYVLINALRAPFLIAKEERELGIWIGYKFVFHEPKHVRTVHLPKDKVEHQDLVKIPYCEPFSSVHLRWEVDDLGDPAAAILGLLPAGTNLAINQTLSKNGECLTWVDESCKVTLVARSTGNGRASVRIYLLDWYLEGMSTEKKRRFPKM